jgi:hypothetical protein
MVSSKHFLIYSESQIWVYEYIKKPAFVKPHGILHASLNPNNYYCFILLIIFKGLVANFKYCIIALHFPQFMSLWHTSWNITYLRCVQQLVYRTRFRVKWVPAVVRKWPFLYHHHAYYVMGTMIYHCSLHKTFPKRLNSRYESSHGQTSCVRISAGQVFPRERPSEGNHSAYFHISETVIKYFCKVKTLDFACYVNFARSVPEEAHSWGAEFVRSWTENNEWYSAEFCTGRTLNRKFVVQCDRC